MTTKNDPLELQPSPRRGAVGDAPSVERDERTEETIMGYTTYFKGQFTLDKPLTPEHKTYLERFAETRHMLWNVSKIMLIPDPVREAARLPLGPDGSYFTGIPDDEHRFSVGSYHPALSNYNEHPPLIPGLWCQWVPTKDGMGIEWDGGEKFYKYTEWLDFLLAHFIQPWGYILNGKVKWQGRDPDDRGFILVENNRTMSVSNMILDHVQVARA